MHLVQRLNHWLETHWATPAYSGWVLLGITLCFLLAATNTLAGWLYVLSGIGLALLTVSAILPVRSLRDLQIERQPIPAVGAGEPLKIGITVVNPASNPKSLLQIHDQVPKDLGQSPQRAIAAIPANESYTWTYTLETRHRGLFRWRTVQFSTAAPLGLFWCRRSRIAQARAIVYPTILNLTQCPLLERTGLEASSQVRLQTASTQASTTGATRSLRPYRWGDPVRLIHWRTSARFNELRTRELETYTSQQNLIIALDSASDWEPNSFEQAVIAAASLYTYACRHQSSVQLWTAAAGLQQGTRRVLETLAQVQPQETPAKPKPHSPLIWLSQQPQQLATLPPHSGWLLWVTPQSSQPAIASMGGADPASGLLIHPDQPLQPQLQSPTIADIPRLKRKKY